MINGPTRLLFVAQARVSRIGLHQVATGIIKEPINSPVMLTVTGLKGDTQVDRRVHGGPEKALYHYPAEHYQRLFQVFPHLAQKLSAPSVGENIATKGLTEQSVHIGDTFSVGDAVIQVSQPRMPCWKINHHLGNAHVAKLFITEAITGWYYRVIQEGLIEAVQELIQIDRMEGSVSIATLWQRWLEAKGQGIDHEKYSSDIPGLSHQWSHLD